MNYIMWKNMLNLVFKLISELELKSIQIDKQTNKQTKNNNANSPRERWGGADSYAGVSFRRLNIAEPIFLFLKTDRLVNRMTQWTFKFFPAV